MGDREEGLRVQRRQLPPERGRAQERPRASLASGSKVPRRVCCTTAGRSHSSARKVLQGGAPGDRQASVWGTAPCHRRPWLPLGHACQTASALRPPGQVSTTCPVSAVGLLPLLPTPPPVRPREGRECRLHDCQEGNSTHSVPQRRARDQTGCLQSH